MGFSFFYSKMLSENFEGGLKMLATQGYKELELFGPYPFSAESAKKAGRLPGKCLAFLEVVILENLL